VHRSEHCIFIMRSIVAYQASDAWRLDLCEPDMLSHCATYLGLRCFDITAQQMRFSDLMLVHRQHSRLIIRKHTHAVCHE